jgi:salicylate hydroxylase
LRQYDIAICGAGPAGLAAALALHRAGHKIMIFDQFDKPRPIGSGLILQPTGLAVLDWLGLGDTMRGYGKRIDRLYGKAEDRVVLDVRYAALGELRGLAVHRAGLFKVLHDALVAAGLGVTTSSKIKSLDGKHVVFDDGRRVGPFDIVIDGLGSRSPLIQYASGPDYRLSMPYGAIWASLPWPGDAFDGHALEQRYFRASKMSGVLPIGSYDATSGDQTAFFWSLKTADYANWKASGLQRWKDDVFALWPETAGLLDTISSQDQMTMASYDHHTLSLPYGANIVFIGDSAHSTSPQLGQGANMALLDVFALTNALASHDGAQSAFATYAQARRRHVQIYQAMSLIFTPFYQSDSRLYPFLRDNLVATASRLAPIQKLLANIVAGHVGR